VAGSELGVGLKGIPWYMGNPVLTVFPINSFG